MPRRPNPTRAGSLAHGALQPGSKIDAQSSELRVYVVSHFQIARFLLISRIFHQKGLTPEESETRDIIYYLKPSFRGLELVLELDLSANDIITMGIVKIWYTVGPKLYQICSKQHLFWNLEHTILPNHAHLCGLRHTK